jgi:hypothetical protein
VEVNALLAEREFYRVCEELETESSRPRHLVEEEPVEEKSPWWHRLFRGR